MSKVVRIIIDRLDKYQFCKNKLHKVLKANSEDNEIHDFFVEFGEDVPSLLFREGKGEAENDDDNSYVVSVKNFFEANYAEQIETFLLDSDYVMFRLAHERGSLYAICVKRTYNEGDKGICVELCEDSFCGSSVSFYEHLF